MLFNSGTFLLQFFPGVFLGFLLLAGLGLQRFAGLWLTVASFVFYGSWATANVPLLIGSILFNYTLGGRLLRRPNRLLLGAGIFINVALLGYFKYTGFVVEVARDLTGAGWAMPSIVLPLAISFFTFQQIAYLVDANEGAVTEHGFGNYCLFITFFPHLVAGPITHHREMLSQFGDPDRFRPRWDFIALGTTMFLVGLFKKVMVADPFGAYATPVFDAAREGGVQLLEAWGGALAYALQMYFDFSGYSDMAIGLSLLFGIMLPANFNSPYKARNVIEYWSRWHMTLTRFLTAYIYNPIVVAITRRRAAKGLPLPKRGRMTAGTFAALVAMPTLVTMLISGVWHGAGWQFVIFGLLHGAFLIVAHGWRWWKVRRGRTLDSGSLTSMVGSVLLTFLCVTVALVFFRAASVGAALDVLRGMAGLNGVTLPTPFERLPGFADVVGRFGIRIGNLPLFDAWLMLRIAVFLFVVWALPNSNQWLRDYPTALGLRVVPSWLERYVPAARWRPTAAFGVPLGAVAIVTILYAISVAPTEFLYFQF